jgi:hypothetical protein
MDYCDAINEVLDRASNIRLPGDDLDVVSIARREFAGRGCCDARLVAPIEQTLRECILRWSTTQKREIWETTETGAEDRAAFEAPTPESIDMYLEDELMFHLIEGLSLDQDGGSRAGWDAAEDGYGLTAG